MRKPSGHWFRRPASLFRYRIYRRLAAVVFVLLAVITLAISASLYALYAETTIQQTALAQSETLSRVSYFADALWAEMDSFASMLFVNHDIFAFLRAHENDPVLRYHAYSALHPYRALYPHIRNISLINFSQHAIVKTNTLFNDEETLRTYLETGVETDRRFGRQIDSDLNGRRSALSVLTIVYPYYMNTKQTSAGIVFDIDQDYLVSTLYEKKENQHNLVIVDGKGGIISTTDADLFLSDASLTPYVRTILDGAGDGGYLLADGETGRVLVTYAKIPRTTWYLIQSQPLGLILAPATRMLAVTILIAALVLCCGIGISLVSLQRTFRTVHTLFGILPVAVPAGQDEFSSLSAYMQSMQTEMESMQQLVHRSTLNGLFFGLEKDEETLEQLQTKLNGKAYCVGYAFCRGTASGEADAGAWAQTFTQAFRTSFSDIAPYDWVLWNDGILFLFALNKAALPEPLFMELENAMRLAGNHCRRFVQMALSGAVPRLADVHDAFMHANQIAPYQFYHHDVFILTQQCMQGYVSGVLPDAQGAVHAAVKAVYAGEYDALIQTLYRFVEEISHLTPMDFRISLRAMLMSFGEVVGRSASGDIMETMRLSIEHVTILPTISEVKDALNAFAQLSLRIVQTQHTAAATHGITMQRVYAYVEENYANAALSINDAATSVSLSANYLGRMFKAYNSLPFTEYLLKVRLEKAEVLLTKTDTPVYRIGEQVGIPNPSYFSHKFKAWYGLTPQQYRKRSIE